eukprot:scaffold10530_cov96-Isochrysis_galbana.AAC.3
MGHGSHELARARRREPSEQRPENDEAARGDRFVPPRTLLGSPLATRPLPLTPTAHIKHASSSCRTHCQRQRRCPQP